MEIRIGVTVRATMPKSQYRRRALVTSIQDDDDAAVSCSYCLLWEDERPKAIEGTFIVSPHFRDDHGNNSSPLKSGEGEGVVARSEISELLSFELDHNDDFSMPPTMMDKEDGDRSSNSNNILVPLLHDKSKSATYWKECGDVLLREKDASAAVAFYELALKRTSRVQVGSTVLVQRKSEKAGGSAIVRADVDCINKDENTIDLTMEEDEDDPDAQDAEQTVPVKHVRLGIDPSLADLQERILLNLTRCLLQLADQCPGHRRKAYLQSARLGCTMALALPEATRQESSLLLRSKAYAASNKFPQALADVRQVLSLNPNNSEGQKLVKDVERQKAAVAQTNKRLAKDVSQWVQTAMAKQEATAAESVSDNGNDEDASASRRRQIPNGVIPTLNLLPWPSLMLALVAILAWIFQAHFSKR
jgi:tetratricopeptide (TPR) repeat protein